MVELELAMFEKLRELRDRGEQQARQREKDEAEGRRIAEAIVEAWITMAEVSKLNPPSSKVDGTATLNKVGNVDFDMGMPFLVEKVAGAPSAENSKLWQAKADLGFCRRVGLYCRRETWTDVEKALLVDGAPVVYEPGHKPKLMMIKNEGGKIYLVRPSSYSTFSSSDSEVIEFNDGVENHTYLAFLNLKDLRRDKTDAMDQAMAKTADLLDQAGIKAFEMDRSHDSALNFYMERQLRLAQEKKYGLKKRDTE